MVENNSSRYCLLITENIEILLIVVNFCFCQKAFLSPLIWQLQRRIKKIRRTAKNRITKIHCSVIGQRNPHPPMSRQGKKRTWDHGGQ